nr:hypothetical protein [Paenibacillus glacialis]
MAVALLGAVGGCESTLPVFDQSAGTLVGSHPGKDWWGCWQEYVLSAYVTVSPVAYAV